MATMYKDDELDTANNITMKGLRLLEEAVEYIQVMLETLRLATYQRYYCGIKTSVLII